MLDRGMPSIQQRVAYYMGNRSCPRVETSDAFRFHSVVRYRCGASRKNESVFRGTMLIYARDMDAFCDPLAHKFEPPSSPLTVRMWMGDMHDYHKPDSNAITKSRHVRDRCGVLLPLNFKRHWNIPSARFLRSVPWHRKKDALVWRGTTTGEGTRHLFVSSLVREHDVRFSGVVQGRNAWVTNKLHLDETKRSIPWLLGFKYLLLLEGNDVATGLKWALSSGSLVFMPPPTKESWLMEGLLEPWKHYVPVSRPEDVPSALAVARANQTLCLHIVRCANAYMDELLAHLLDPVEEVVTLAAHMARYGTKFRSTLLHPPPLSGLTF